MGIKLEVPQTGGGRNYMDAPSTNLSGNFGKQSQQLVNLPSINAGEQFSTAMANANAMGAAYRNIGQGLQQAGNDLYAFAKAEDQMNGQKMIVQLNEERAKISTSYLEKASRGEITFEHAADSAYKDFETLSQDRINTSEFAFGDIRDEVTNRIRTANSNAWESDKKTAILKTTERLKDSFKEETQMILKGASSDIASYVSAKETLNTQYTNDKRGLIEGADHFNRVKEIGLQTAGKTLIANYIKSDPNKAEQMLNDGSFQPVLDDIPESERDVFIRDIQQAKRTLDIQNYQDTNRLSSDTFGEYSLRLAKNETVNESEVLNDKRLQPDDQARIINALSAANASQNKQFEKIQAVSETIKQNGNAYTATNEQVEAHANVLFGPKYKDILNKPAEMKQLAQQMYQVYGRLPDSFIYAINNSRPESGKSEIEIKNNEKSWATTVTDLQKTLPDESKKLNQNNLDIANKIINIGMNYQEARDATNDYSNNKNNEEFLNKAPVDKQSKFFKEPGKAIQEVLETDVEIDLTIQKMYEKQYRLESYNGGTDEEIAKRTISKMGIGVSELGGTTKVMFNPPDKMFNDQGVDKPVFENQMEQVKSYAAREYGVDHVDLRYNKFNGSYEVINPNTGGPILNQQHQPITINIDTKQNMQIMDAEKKYNPAGFMGKKQFTEENNRLSELESQFPELSKHPGLMNKIWSIESSNGRNQYNASSGAAGHFQMIPGTKAMLEKMMGKKINPYDFNSSAEAASFYFDYLLKQNNGNLAEALFDWSGAKSDKAKKETLANYRKLGVNV